MEWISVLPFGGALAARLRHRQWQVWAAWGAVSLIALAVVWITANFASAFYWMVGASAFGFLGPELWEACRGFMRQPKVFGWILAAGAIVFAIYHPQFLGSILTIVIIYAAFRLMLKPLLGGGGKKRRR